MKQFWWFNLITRRYNVNIYTSPVVRSKPLLITNQGADTGEVSSLASIKPEKEEDRIESQFRIRSDIAVCSWRSLYSINNRLFLFHFYFRQPKRLFSMCESQAKHSHKFNWNAKAIYGSKTISANSVRFQSMINVFDASNSFSLRGQSRDKIKVPFKHRHIW